MSFISCISCHPTTTAITNRATDQNQVCSPNFKIFDILNKIEKYPEIRTKTFTATTVKL